MEIKNHFRLFYFIFCWFALVRGFCFVFDSLPAKVSISIHFTKYFFSFTMNSIFSDVEGSIQCSSHRKKKSSRKIFYSQKRRKFYSIAVRGSRDVKQHTEKKIQLWWINGWIPQTAMEEQHISRKKTWKLDGWWLVDSYLAGNSVRPSLNLLHFTLMSAYISFIELNVLQCNWKLNTIFLFFVWFCWCSLAFFVCALWWKHVEKFAWKDSNELWIMSINSLLELECKEYSFEKLDNFLFSQPMNLHYCSWIGWKIIEFTILPWEQWKFSAFQR